MQFISKADNIDHDAVQSEGELSRLIEFERELVRQDKMKSFRAGKEHDSVWADMLADMQVCCC